MELRVLGPVEVWGARGAVPGGEPRGLAVLTALALDAGRVVPAGTLVDRVWGQDPPARAAATLRAYVSRIRRVLEDAAGEPGAVGVESRAGGYRLSVAPDRVDLLRFRLLVQQARAADGAGRARRLRAATALWRGEPLGGVAGEWAARLRDQLVAERLAATAAWADAELRLGNAAAVLPVVGPLAGEHPLMEALVEVQARALVAVGRPTQALECCRSHRALLAEEYGTEQGAQLRALYRRILRGETSALVTPPVAPLRPGPPACTGARPPGAARSRRPAPASGRCPHPPH